MSLQTIESPHVAVEDEHLECVAANNTVSSEPRLSHDIDSVASRPTIGTGRRSRLFLKLLPLAGLAWAWMLEGSELAAVGLGTWTGFVLLAMLLVAAASDLATHKIPNAITYPAFAWILGLGIVREAISYFGIVAGTESLSPAAARCVAVIGGPPLVEQMAGAVMCFGIMFFMFIVAKTGGGDVKLSTAIGLALGPMAGVAAIVAAYIAGCCYALCWTIVKFGPVRVVVGFSRLIGTLVLPLWVKPPTKDDERLLFATMPMGAAFVVGTLFAIYQFSHGRSF
jgi:prepilin signal peptidase PulO-like enzyme (type II secretory pathway)